MKITFARAQKLVSLVAWVVSVAWFAPRVAAAPVGVAVVVGVNHYPNLPGANLKGCLNDAALMRDDLKKYGFEVTYLPDAQKGAIQAAIQSAAARKPARFVFYFAGHGTRLTNGDGALLPSDANDKTEYSLLSATELYDLVAVIPATARSVILDSCHSGAMMRAKSLLAPGTRARYYDLQGEAARRGQKLKAKPLVAARN